MDIKAGDRVRYLNAKGGGVVSKILSNGIVQVLDETGFEIPFHKTELVRVEDDFNTTTMVPQRKSSKPVEPPKPVVVEKSLIPENDDEVPGNDLPRIYLGVVPTSSMLDSFEVYLINDCNYHLMYNFSCKRKKMLDVIDIGTLEANTKALVTTVKKDALQESHQFVVQGIFFKKMLHTQQDCLQKDVNLSPVKFFKDGCFRENDFFDENAMVCLLYTSRRG